MVELTGQDGADADETSERKSAQIDRVILGRAQSELVAKWTTVLNERADGLIRFSKADVVNFLLASHPPTFTQEEVRAISSVCYNEAKWLSWGLTKVKAAKKSGAAISFDDLMRFRDELLAPATTKTRIKKQKSSEALAAQSGAAEATNIEDDSV